MKKLIYILFFLVSGVYAQDIGFLERLRQELVQTYTPLPDVPFLAQAEVVIHRDSYYGSIGQIVNNQDDIIAEIRSVVQGHIGLPVGGNYTIRIASDGAIEMQQVNGVHYSLGEPPGLDFKDGNVNDTYTIFIRMGEVLSPSDGTIISKAGNSARQYYVIANNTTFFVQAHGQTSNTTEDLLNISKPYNLHVEVGNTSGSFIKYINGVVSGSAATASTAVNDVDVRIGARSSTDTAAGAGSFYGTGSIRGIIIYRTTFNATDTQIILDWMDTYLDEP